MNGHPLGNDPGPGPGGRSQDYPFRIQKPRPVVPPDEMPDDRPVHSRSPIRDPWRKILFMNLRTFLIVAVGIPGLWSPIPK